MMSVSARFKGWNRKYVSVGCARVGRKVNVDMHSS